MAGEKPDDDEELIVVDDDGGEEEEAPSLDDDTGDEGQDGSESEPSADDPDAALTGKERRDRYEERFSKLTKLVKEKDEVVTRLQQELDAFKASQQESTTRQRVERDRERAQADAVSAKKALQEASDSGDIQAALEAQQRLTKASDFLAKADAYLKRPPVAQPQRPASQPAPQQTQQPSQTRQQPPSEEALKWAQTVRFATWPQERKEQALAISDRMIAEGGDPESPDFYRAISRELGLSVRPKSSPVGQPQRRKGGTTKTVTAEERAIMRELGINDPEQMKAFVRERERIRAERGE